MPKVTMKTASIKFIGVTPEGCHAKLDKLLSNGFVSGVVSGDAIKYKYDYRLHVTFKCTLSKNNVYKVVNAIQSQPITFK